MTVQELYNYSFENFLLDKEVSQVISLYEQSNKGNKESDDYFNDLVEYSYEDVLKLLTI